MYIKYNLKSSFKFSGKITEAVKGRPKSNSSHTTSDCKGITRQMTLPRKKMSVGIFVFKEQISFPI